MPHGLASIAALALVGVGLVDGAEVGAQADLVRPHLGDNRADRPMGAHMCGERSFSRSDPQFEEFSAVFVGFPGSFPLHFHGLSDGGLRGCRQCRAWS